MHDILLLFQEALTSSPPGCTLLLWTPTSPSILGLHHSLYISTSTCSLVQYLWYDVCFLKRSGHMVCLSKTKTLSISNHLPCDNAVCLLACCTYSESLLLLTSLTAGYVVTRALGQCHRSQYDCM